MSAAKKLFVCILSFIFFFVCCVFSNNGTELLPVSSVTEDRQTVLIDAGHGGFDGGAVAADGTPEKDINLSIAKKLAELLRFHGYEVIMTRESDTGTETDSSGTIAERKKSDMYERLRMMEENSEAIFVSIHMNKFTTSKANGAQVFYSQNREDSYRLGLSIQRSVKTLLQPENERTVKKGSESTFLLHRATVPAVIVECGFLSNKAELELLKTEEYQNKMAFAVLCGIINYGS